VTACALVRPSRISDLSSKSVKKKLKDRSFAAAVNREEIRACTESIGEDLTEHIDFVIDAMREIAATLELEGHA